MKTVRISFLCKTKYSLLELTKTLGNSWHKLVTDKRDELTNEKEDLGPVEDVRKRMNRTVSYHR